MCWLGLKADDAHTTCRAAREATFSGLGCRELFDDRQVRVEDLVTRLYYWFCFP